MRNGAMWACASGLSGAMAALAADLALNTATYLGGDSDGDVVYAVDIGTDNSIVLGGTMPGHNPGDVAPAELIMSGSGIVLRMSSDGLSVLGAARLGDYVADLEVGPSGTIAASGSFGVAVLAADLSRVLWADTTVAVPYVNFGHPQSRVAFGSDGTVALMHTSARYECHVYVYDEGGQRLFDTLFADKYPGDICVDGRSGRFVIGGFHTLSADSKYMLDHPIHMPYIRAFSYDGALGWIDYEWEAAQVYEMNTFADSRVERLTIGRDGYMYMGGYIHGGDHVFKHDPHDVTSTNTQQAGFDAFSNPYSMAGGAHYSYFGKYDPSTGDFVMGEALIARLAEDGSGKSAELAIRGIHADELGRVFLVGWCAAYIKDRMGQTVAGQQIGPYYGREPYLAVVAPGLRSREVWTVFSRVKCLGSFWGVSTRNGVAACAGAIDTGMAVATGNAVQSEPAIASDGYLVAWGAPTSLGDPGRGRPGRGRANFSAGASELYTVAGRRMGPWFRHPTIAARRSGGGHCAGVHIHIGSDPVN